MTPDPDAGEAPDETADDDDAHLMGSAGADVSAGIVVSGVGGESLRPDRREAGLPPVDEQGAKLAWGKDVEASEDDEDEDD
jgi:hypothetical protein